MGKAAKWLRLLLTGKREKKERYGPSSVPMETLSGPISMHPSKEKRRWSFRRSVTGTAMEQKSAHVRGYLDSNMDRQAAAMAAEAPAAAEQTAAEVIRLTNRATETVEEAAAIKIQSVFRSYLVRRQATATLRSMQATVTAQARARTQRMWKLEEAQAMSRQRHNTYRRLPQEVRSRQSYEMEANINIVEMDLGESRGSSKSKNNYTYGQAERRDHRLATYSGSSTPYRRELQHDTSPVRSALTDRSPRAHSGHFGEYFITSESRPPYLSTSSIHDMTKSPLAVSQDYLLFPNYMANTESSRAKARPHTAPKQRPDSYERPPCRQRPVIEGRSVSREARTQQSSSHMSSAAEGYRHPWSIKLDRSTVSLQESEVGSTSTVLTNTKYARSLMAYDIHSELSSKMELMYS